MLFLDYFRGTSIGKTHTNHTVTGMPAVHSTPTVYSHTFWRINYTGTRNLCATMSKPEIIFFFSDLVEKPQRVRNIYNSA